MCGILGYVGSNESVYDNFDSALDLLHHRVYRRNEVIFGHRRLSIIDLSKDGHQPFIDDDCGNVIVFNGEIYNYIELKEILSGLGYHFK